MLIAFLALLALINGTLGWLGRSIGFGLGHVLPLPGAERWHEWNWSLTAVLSYAFAPLAWLMGIEGKDCLLAGRLLGERMVANEFVAYVHLGEWLKAGSEVALSNRSVVILTYALCGFANFGSIGIQIGGIGAIAPGRRTDLARLGLRAMLGGTLASCMTACVVGILADDAMTAGRASNDQSASSKYHIGPIDESLWFEAEGVGQQVGQPHLANAVALVGIDQQDGQVVRELGEDLAAGAAGGQGARRGDGNRFDFPLAVGYG
jgi:CNT family concentrative nucleoside transporter